jgi:aryl-alcohol dehydrogenase-like predicted oxidoreductase
VNYRLLGSTGLRVSEFALGTMTFGTGMIWGAPKDENRRIFDAYSEAGGNFIDTADGYMQGNSECTVGEFVAGQRERYVVATKYTFSKRPGDPNSGGNHRKNMVQALEGSLKRLGVDYIDLYWVHAWDELTPADEVMRGLNDLVRAGKILYVGISNAPAWVVSYSNAIAQLRGWTPFAGLQVEYSLIERTPERDLIPMAAELGVTLTAWSPLGGGFLSGKYVRNVKPLDGRVSQFVYTELSDANFDIADAVKTVAAELGRTPAQIALSWLRRKGALPIIGARTLSQLKENLGALEIVLSDEHMQLLDRVSAVSLGFPHDFLQAKFVRERLHAGTFDRIHRTRKSALSPVFSPPSSMARFSGAGPQGAGPQVNGPQGNGRAEPH